MVAERSSPLYTRNKRNTEYAYNSPSDKTVSTTRAEFLDALYRTIDPKLWIELRCIHPVSKLVKTQWMPVQQRTAILKQADALNREGYGLYFAPCPRTQHKGSAEAAALLPALWADRDCANDPVRREAALATLQAFTPSPSVIVDSSGGWHSYWILSEPFSLIEPTNRAYAARLLRGLFSAVGADPEYVKSVASIMRLPESVNTKPERHGAIVTIVEFVPDRCYSLADFAWLEVSTKPSTGALKHTQADQPPLPRVTLDYLAHGATNGTRNQALFDAACQFRDAGYSPSEAEAQVIPRYVADESDENLASRDREAHATIASAYRSEPREALVDRHLSLPTSESPAHEQVERLVSQYNVQTAEATHPTVDQIAQVVQQCASLDALHWAVERKRLKSVCGSDFTIADLDRLYRQARRVTTRQHSTTTMPDGDRYLAIDGGMVLERETDRGVTRQGIATWTGRVVEWITQVDNEE